MSQKISWICPECFYQNEDWTTFESYQSIYFYCQKCNYSTDDLNESQIAKFFLNEQAYIKDVVDGKKEPSAIFKERWQSKHWTLKEM